MGLFYNLNTMNAVSMFCDNKEILIQLNESIKSIAKFESNKNLLINIFLTSNIKGSLYKDFTNMINKLVEEGWNFKIVDPLTDEVLSQIITVKKNIRTTANKLLSVMHSKANNIENNLILDCDTLILGNLNDAFVNASEDYSLQWTGTNLTNSRKAFLNRFGNSGEEAHNNSHGNGGFALINVNKFFEDLAVFNDELNDLEIFNFCLNKHLNNFKKFPFCLTLRTKCDELFYHQFIPLKNINSNLSQNYNVNRLFDLSDFIKQFESHKYNLLIIHYMSIGNWFNKVANTKVHSNETHKELVHALMKQHKDFKDNEQKATIWTDFTIENLDENKNIG